jgi:hypothetical protein
LVLSAYPSSFQKLPDPFREGLKVERIEEMREIPKIAGNVAAPLQQANLKDVIDTVLQSDNASEAVVQQICDTVVNDEPRDTALFYQPINVDVVLVNALVLYIGQQAATEHASKSNTRSVFENSNHAALLEKLAQAMQPEARYYLLSAMANQLRYPNSHTYFFSFTILRLFGVDYSEQDESDIRQQIIRVLLERLIVHRPHPWGLIITLQELLQNRSYSFFRLPFIQAAPEVCFYYSVLYPLYPRPRTGPNILSYRLDVFSTLSCNTSNSKALVPLRNLCYLPQLRIFSRRYNHTALHSSLRFSMGSIAFTLLFYFIFFMSHVSCEGQGGRGGCMHLFLPVCHDLRMA